MADFLSALLMPDYQSDDQTDSFQPDYQVDNDTTNVVVDSTTTTNTYIVADDSSSNNNQDNSNSINYEAVFNSALKTYNQLEHQQHKPANPPTYNAVANKPAKANPLLAGQQQTKPTFTGQQQVIATGTGQPQTIYTAHVATPSSPPTHTTIQQPMQTQMVQSSLLQMAPQQIYQPLQMVQLAPTAVAPIQEMQQHPQMMQFTFQPVTKPAQFSSMPPMVTPAMTHTMMQAAVDKCAKGHMYRTKYGVCGVVSAILLFPIGFMCMMIDKREVCTRCDHVRGDSRIIA